MNYIKTHIVYLLIILGGVLLFRTWLSEHDARKEAEKQVAVSEATVKSLQAQIIVVQNQATQKAAVITQIVKAAKTPAQQIAAIPQLTNAPLNARTEPGLPDGVVAVDLAPLVAELASCKQDAIALQACTDTSTLKDKQLAEKDDQIKILKKKPKFWHTVKKDLELVGTGVAIAVALRGGKL